MKATGIVRRADDLGRIVFSKKLEEPSKSAKATRLVQHLHLLSYFNKQLQVSTYGAEIKAPANSNDRYKL